MTLSFLPHWINDYEVKQLNTIDRFENEGCHECQKELDRDSVHIVEAPGHPLHKKCWTVWMGKVLDGERCFCSPQQDVAFVNEEIEKKPNNGKLSKTFSSSSIAVVRTEGSDLVERKDLLSSKEFAIRNKQEEFYRAVKDGNLEQVKKIYLSGGIKKETIRWSLSAIEKNPELKTTIEQLVKPRVSFDCLCKKVAQIFTCCFKRA